MEEKLKELLIRIEYLEKLINSTQQWLILTWAILAVIVAILSITITILVKKWVDKRVSENLAVIKKDLKEELRQDLKKYIDSNRVIKWASGNIMPMYASSEIVVHLNENKSINLEFPNQLEVIAQNKNEKIEYEASIKDGVLKIHLKNYDKDKHGNLVYWQMIWFPQNENDK